MRIFAGQLTLRFCSRCFTRCADKRAEQRMRLQRLRFELGVELTAEEPRDGSAISQISTYTPSGVWPVSLQTVSGEDLLEFAIELVAVAMALADLALAVGALGRSCLPPEAGICAETHRAAEFVNALQLA